ncbi:antigen peptide transporter 2 [Cyprinodon tularosa]|uniref:antigen peptide transporter 2 n=1 Tax=Cyprinodon tularosa TaxID=77115 RepID=UPI0018E221D3|nr:antigen peptide transporter 2 [Cyprinodon tularosa]
MNRNETINVKVKPKVFRQLTVSFLWTGGGGRLSLCSLANHQQKVMGVITGLLCIILLDGFLCSARWAGLLLLKCSSCGGLAGLWAFGLIKWAFLHLFIAVLTSGKHRALLYRFAALLCLISPVFETGRILTALPSERYTGPLLDPSMLLLGSTSSLVACLIWEKWISRDGQTKKDNLDTKRLLMRVLRYFKPDTVYLITAFSFLIMGVICDTYIPLYQGKVIDMLSERQLQSDFGYTVGHLVLIYSGSALFSGMRGGFFMISLARLNKRLKHLLFHNLLKQEVHFFEENNPGRLSSRLHSDVDRMGRTVALNANAVVRSTFKTVLMLRVMLGLSWELTLLTCIEMPLLATLQNKYINLSKELKDQTQECHAQSKDLASQTIGGIRTVRSFNAEKEELRRYLVALEELCSIKRRSAIFSAVYLVIRRVVSLGIKIFMLIQARRLISSGQLSIGNLVSFFLYQKPMSVNLREIMYCYGETMSTVGVISKVLSYLDRTPKTKEEGNLAPKVLEGRVVFQNINFSYPSAPSEKAALKSVSLEIRPGKITALVGPSGGGKSSCVSLLKRLYEPQDGQILLDGKPLHCYQGKYFHQKVALVSQNPVLFSGSLKYNIEYGLEKPPPEEKVKEVARKIDAHKFISEMENGYDTDVGECGGKLSEGQKQSIAIIRALLRDPQVIILDEATSKLDVDAERAVLDEVLNRGRTILMVAHQLRIVEKADHIIFMEDGSVREEGTHQELMKKKGGYFRLKEELFSESR